MSLEQNLETDASTNEESSTSLSPRRRGGKLKGTSNWSDKKRLEVVTTYLAIGSAELTAAICKVPPETIRVWKMKPWWKDAVALIRTEESIALDGKLKKIIDKSIDSINDRLENGDFIFDSKSGEFKRAPVKLRDVNAVAVQLIDKRILIQKEQREKTTDEAVVDRLAKLAEQFAEFVKKKEKVIEGEYLVISGNTVSCDAEREQEEKEMQN